MLKITVVTVCFNAERTIQETIHSVLNQTYKNIEYVIVDGVSKDNTLNIIHDIQTKYRYCDIKLLSEPDRGIYDAMNKALDLATGDYLIFLGADDHFISYNILERVVPLLVEREKNYYGSVLRPLRNDLYCGKFNKYKLAVKNLPHQGIFYCREVYKKNRYDISVKVFADYKYNLLVWKTHNYLYLKLPIAYFESSGTSGTIKDWDFDKQYRSLVLQSLGVMPYLYSLCYRKIRKLLKR